MALIIVFQNISALAPISDYKVQVLVGDGTPERSRLLYDGYVRNHARVSGWPMLVQQFVTHLPEDV